jgi:hypothetical protein
VRPQIAKNGSVAPCPAFFLLDRVLAELLQADEDARANSRRLLTAEGVLYIRARLARNAKSRRIPAAAAPRIVPVWMALPVPFWDAVSRCLWLGERLLKQFRQPAPNQTRLLDVFQEQGWENTHIDDPLLILQGETEADAKRRLHETVKNLNRTLPPGTIWFRGDGTGQGATWEYDERLLDAAANWPSANGGQASTMLQHPARSRASVARQGST